MAMVSCRKAFTAKLLQNAKKNADIFAVATDSRAAGKTAVARLLAAILQAQGMLSLTPPSR